MSYANYIKNYDRKAYDEGSDHDPAVDRFSGLDVRKMFRAGTKDYGKSKAEAAKMVLDYADSIKGKSKMGGATRDALNKLKGFLEENNKEPDKNNDRPKEVREDQERFEETRLEKPENQMPRLEDAYKETPELGDGEKDASFAAIKGGDDLNEWYQTKFVPHLEADANATNSEIGDDSRYFLSKFVFEPPKLGSIKEIYDKYKSEIEDLG